MRSVFQEREREVIRVIHEGEGVLTAGAAAWPGAERQVARQRYLHHLAGFDRDVADGDRGERLPLGRRDRRVIAQHLVDGPVPGSFEQGSGGLASLHQHPDAGCGRLVEGAAKDLDQPGDRRVCRGFVAGTGQVCLCDIAHQVHDGLVDAHLAGEDRHRVGQAAASNGLHRDRVQDGDRQRAPALVCFAGAEPADGGP